MVLSGKNLRKKNTMKKQLIRWIIFALIVVGISGVAYLLCWSCGITNIAGIRSMIDQVGVWGWLVFLILQVFVTSLLCFVPATSMTFIVCSVILFGAWKGFAISSIGVVLSSISMFLIGRFGGEKLAKRLVGEENLKKAQDLVAIKSKIYLPLMFVLPLFPDDALCMVAGMTKMKWWHFLLIVIFCRTIGVAVVCFLGSDFIKWNELSVIDWFVFISVCIIDILLIVHFANKLESKIKSKRQG